MAVVSPVPAIPRSFGSVRLPQDFGVTSNMAGMGEIVEEPETGVVNDTIYVAVTKDLKESKSNLTWAIQNSGGNKICILHVHVPATMIPLMGTKFPASSLKEDEVEAYRELERQNMHKSINEYILFSSRMGARAEKLHIEMECAEKGIVELAFQHGIRELVMGAASDNRHSRKMMDLKSKKAIYVREHAPAYCQIRFVCKGRLIHNRNRCLGDGNEEAASPLPQHRPSPVHSLHLRSQSITLGQNDRARLINEKLELLRRARSAIAGQERKTVIFSSPDTEGFSSPSNRLSAEVSSDGSDGLLRKSPSVFSTCSESGTAEVALTPKLISEGSENVIDSSEFSPAIASLCRSSPPSNGGMDDTLYYQLEQAMSEAESARRDAFRETLKRGKAEKEAVDAMRRAKASESLYKEVLKQRKQIEEALAKEREELEGMKSLRDKVKEELRLALDQKMCLGSQIESSEFMVRELKQKIISVVDLLTICKKERDELQMQRNDALKEAEELRKIKEDVSSTHGPELFSEFSFQEIEQATRNFNSSLKIGEGGYGNIYKGVLRHTEVAIKMLHANNSSQGPAEFQQEVDVLSKLRHPNLITLIGACPESWTLVYEYLPNGSLEDRLNCKDNTAPLSWQARIRIAAELCSALIFLHSFRPHCIVHGDLKPSNVLLDANFVSKLGDFGICRILPNIESSGDDTTDCWRTIPKGTLVYMDPEFLASGELTLKSDVYSFGIILLRLLTGRPALGITKEVQYALDSGKFQSLLDSLAGDWPFVQAEQLARVALRCCELSRKNRPDLRSDVWKILEAMSAFSGGTYSFKPGYEGSDQPPSYFICPIFQEVMLDPHIAADGFSYEGEAIRGWFDSGHSTSPMTNARLEHHNLVPNHALRSAIRDWLQHH
ncbi:U-box domain-containing protein 33-like isoform X2 [Prosopis cineraria]|uniref:U-box domain-containing protein 33-like isoform X2 n=1 Tax=Prosopis cineraria TaxID=364024 RepID=UPI00240F722A|nr:U-box domain-containing protein 33-like isoform X2 [Prosopis cineraria]